MPTASSSPSADFSGWVLLEYPDGGIEVARELPEEARIYCLLGAREYGAGRLKTARGIFTEVLRRAVSPKLAARFRKFTVPELAELAAHLLNFKFDSVFPGKTGPSPEAVKKAAARILRAGGGTAGVSAAVSPESSAGR